MKVFKKDLQEAEVVLNSLLSKCEKAQLKLVKDILCHTLLKNRFIPGLEQPRASCGYAKVL